MSLRTSSRWLAVGVAGVAVMVGVVGAAVALAEVRTWSDAKGKFKVEAELISFADGQVTLKTDKGRQIRVPIERLSEADQEFVRSQPEAPAAKGGTPLFEHNRQIREVARVFYNDLRTTERSEAKDLLVPAAKAWVEEGKSPLAKLPSPDKSPTAVKIGKAEVEENAATIPVEVRVGGAAQKTKLHLRLEDDQWRVTAISAVVGSDEKKLSFEPSAEPPAVAAADAPAGPPADPLAALIGKPLEVHGVSVDGRPLDFKTFSGKVVLVDFWATWCGPCRAEMPNIRANWEKYHAQGFEVIAVSVDRDLEALKKYLLEEQPPWAVVADAHPANGKSMAGQLQIRGIPAFVLIGADGNVAAINCRGPRLGAELAKLLGNGGA